MTYKEWLEKKIEVQTEIFLRNAKTIHGNRFDYSKSKVIKKKENICIICPSHGEFYQTPYIHLKSKYCCPKCYRPNPPKGPYIKKRPPKPLPEEVINGTSVWIKHCPKCSRKQTYCKESYRRRAVKLNIVCK